MKLASKLKLDQQPCPLSVAAHLLQQVDGFLAEQAHGHSAVLEDLNVLARKLDNPKLLDQCKVLSSQGRKAISLLKGTNVLSFILGLKFVRSRSDEIICRTRMDSIATLALKNLHSANTVQRFICQRIDILKANRMFLNLFLNNGN